MSNKQNYINGVNWATMKKIAKFVFGVENCTAFKKVNQMTYIIYIDKSTYQTRLKLVERFETFWNVTIKPID